MIVFVMISVRCKRLAVRRCMIASYRWYDEQRTEPTCKRYIDAVWHGCEYCAYKQRTFDFWFDHSYKMAIWCKIVLSLLNTFDSVLAMVVIFLILFHSTVFRFCVLVHSKGVKKHFCPFGYKHSSNINKNLYGVFVFECIVYVSIFVFVYTDKYTVKKKQTKYINILVYLKKTYKSSTAKR